MAQRSLNVFLIGPPASGKTTVRSYLANLVAKKRERSPLILGIEEAQRSLRPKEVQDGSYYYNSDGGLVLLDRKRQVIEATLLLASHCGVAGSDGFLCELAHPEIIRVMLAHFEQFLDRSLVLALSGPLQVRLERNMERTDLRMPFEVVESMPDSLPNTAYNQLRDHGAVVESIDSSRMLEDTLRQVEVAIASYIG